MSSSVQPAAETFSAHRSMLTGVAYRVLGRVTDAEDVVQDAWLRWDSVDHATVADPKSFLVRVVTRLAIDRLRSAQARHESYVGEWLPEPVLTSTDLVGDVEQSESVSMAMLVVLEKLSPLERAVFVLRDVFGYSYPDIGEIVDRNEPAVRQLASRARQHVQRGKPRFDTDEQVRRAATERFLEVSAGGDLQALLELLAPEVQLHSDGGGRAKAPVRPIIGADKVGRFLIAIAMAPPTDGEIDVRVDVVNGHPGIIALSGGAPFAVFVLDTEGGVVRQIHLLANPDKLAGVRDQAARIT